MSFPSTFSQAVGSSQCPCRCLLLYFPTPGIRDRACTGAVGERVAEEDIEKVGEKFVLKQDASVIVHARAFKMSKSRGNVVNPDDVVVSYGADSLRLYEMFMGPLRDTKVWSTKSVEGVHRFLARVWRMFENGAQCFPPVPWPLCSHAQCIGLLSACQGVHSVVSACVDLLFVCAKLNSLCIFGCIPLLSCIWYSSWGATALLYLSG